MSKPSRHALFHNGHKKNTKKLAACRTLASVQLTMTMNLQACNGTKGDDFLSLKLLEVIASMGDKWPTGLEIIGYKSYSKKKKTPFHYDADIVPAARDTVCDLHIVNMQSTPKQLSLHFNC